jgi:DNA-binding ferritin-like protein (Dps family)
MAAKWIELVTGSLEQKKQYRHHKARVAALPTPYRAATEAVERYLTYFGGITQGDTLLTMLTDLGDLFEQSAAAGTLIRDIVGDDPVEFAETFLANYSEGQWINKERRRLRSAIAAAIDASANTNPDGPTDATARNNPSRAE